MLKKIALFGPPGVGKSTIVNLAKQKGLNAFDAEKLGKNYIERRKNTLKSIKKYSKQGIIIGSADLKPTDFPNEFDLILLMPSFNVFISRVKLRNQKLPKKAMQNEIIKFQAFEDMSKNKIFDRIITNNDNPEKTLLEILGN